MRVLEETKHRPKKKKKRMRRGERVEFSDFQLANVPGNKVRWAFGLEGVGKRRKKNMLEESDNQRRF